MRLPIMQFFTIRNDVNVKGDGAVNFDIVYLNIFFTTLFFFQDMIQLSRSDEASTLALALKQI